MSHSLFRGGGSLVRSLLSLARLLMFTSMGLVTLMTPAYSDILYSVNVRTCDLVRIDPTSGMVTVVGKLNIGGVPIAACPDVDLAPSFDRKTLWALNSFYG